MIIASLLSLGFTSAAAQILFMRELIVNFYGNEFFIGWVFFVWLGWVALGSLTAKLITRQTPSAHALPLTHLLVAVLIPVELLILRASKLFICTVPGQIPNVVPVLVVSFLALAPLCFVLGIQFSILANAWKINRPQSTRVNTAGESYLIETIGFVVGGLVFSYGFVHSDEIAVSAILGLVNLAAGAVLCHVQKINGKKYVQISILFLGMLFLFGFITSNTINLKTVALKFKNEALVETKNSFHGNITVTSANGQYHFYQNGLFSGADHDDLFNELLTHIPMLSHPNPKKVFLIGNGFNGAIREILKHAPSDVYYGEPDPELISVGKKYISPTLKETLRDRRVHVIEGDVRHFLNFLPNDFDVVIINLSNPSTALLNRYFTDEFFRQIRLHLKPNGLLSTHLAFSPNIVTAPLENLGTSVYNTLRKEFQSVAILPEDTLFMIASEAPVVTNPEILIERLRAQMIQTYFVNEPFLRYRYTTDRIRQVRNIFDSNRAAGKNSDFEPRSYFYNLIFWLSTFYPNTAKWVATVEQIPYLIFVCICMLLVLLPFYLGRKHDRISSTHLLIAMGTSGFSLMVAQMLIIYTFQVLYGNLYYRIAWIISFCMAGMAIGTYVGNRIRSGSLNRLVTIHIGIGLYFVCWLLFLQFSVLMKWFVPEIMWLILAFFIGGVVGYEFAYVNHLALSPQPKSHTSHAGLFYSADLFGSCIGALLTGIFLIPIFGVFQTLLLLGIMNLVLALQFFSYRTH